MFLATTGLTEFWDTQDELLMLGPWCLRYDRRSIWQGLRYHLLPRPWDDRQRFYEAVRYLDACGERVLQRLADYLNGAHGVSHDLRYWRVLLGPWLMHYLHAAYDRYVHLTEAFRQYPCLRTLMLDPRSYRVPWDIQEFLTWFSDDLYNLQLCSQHLRLLGYVFPTRAVEHPEEDRRTQPSMLNDGQGSPIRWARRCVSRTLERLARRFGGRRWQVLLSEMYCAKSQMWALAWRMRLRALPYEIQETWPFDPVEPVFDQKRQALASLPAGDEFERVLTRCLPQDFPILYLEGYHAAWRQTLREQRWWLPQILVSSTGWYFNEPFKFLAAGAAERGSRLVAVQHGGGYGIFRCVASEQHEARLANTFAVWGWATPHGATALRNLPSPRLSSMSDTGTRRRRRKGREILYTSTAHLRYLLRFHSFPIGIQSGAYRQWQCRFLTAVPSRLRADIRFRLYMYEYGDATRARLQDQFPGLRFDAGRRFEQRLTQVRVVVIDHCGTTFLEALRVGVPTIIFWDPQLTEVRGEVEPHLARLRQAGILWDTPEAAAAKLAEIYDDPWAWWGTEAVQAARRRFVDRYALGRDQWVDDWAKVLKDELALTKDMKKS